MKQYKAPVVVATTKPSEGKNTFALRMELITER